MAKDDSSRDEMLSRARQLTDELNRLLRKLHLEHEVEAQVRVETYGGDEAKISSIRMAFVQYLL